MTRTSRRGIAVLAGTLVAAFLLTACVPAPVRPPTGPTGETVSPALAPYYGQRLSWADCGKGMECATAKAPLDWSNPVAADDIKLAMTRQRATGGSRVGSLFVNPGGPGASGYDFIYNNINTAVSKDLQAGFDVIGWDPRGVGRSTAVNCYNGPQLDSFLFGLPTAKVGTPEYDAQVRGASKAFVDACTQKTGRLLEFVDTVSTVKDLDMLRAVVGDKKLNYFGFSYGSDIGSRYAQLFASNVGRMTLDGATDPTVTSFDVQLAQTVAFGKALKTYLADCLAQRGCPFAGSTVDQAVGEIRALLRRLDASPLRHTDGRLLTSAYLSTAITAALYDQNSWRYLTDAFTEVLAGKTATTFLLADYYVDRNPDGTYKSNFFQAFFAINCMDYPVVTDPAVLAQQRDQLAAVDVLNASEDLNALGDTVCQQWPYKFRGTIGPVTAAGAPPILVVGTTGDPATPYQWAQSLASQLSSGVLLTYVGQGHIAYDEGVPCINSAVDSYFLKGTVPAPGLRCTA